MTGSLCSIALSFKGSGGVQACHGWQSCVSFVFVPSQLSCHTLACMVPRSFVVEGDACFCFFVFSFVCMSVCFFSLPDVEVVNPGTPAAQLHYYVMLLFLVVLLFCFSCSCATPSSLVLISGLSVSLFGGHGRGYRSFQFCLLDVFVVGLSSRLL